MVNIIRVDINSDRQGGKSPAMERTKSISGRCMHLATRYPRTTRSTKDAKRGDSGPSMRAIMSEVSLKAAFSKPRLPPGEMPRGGVG